MSPFMLHGAGCDCPGCLRSAKVARLERHRARCARLLEKARRAEAALDELIALRDEIAARVGAHVTSEFLLRGPVNVASLACHLMGARARNARDEVDFERRAASELLEELRASRNATEV